MAAPGQSFMTQGAGAYFTNQTLSKELRSVAQPLARFRQFCRRDPQFGKRSGSKLLFNKLSNLAADASTGAIIAEGQPIPRDGFTTTQGECLAVPSGQGIPWTEEYEVQSEFEPRDPIESRAVDHMAKAMDYRASVPFTSAPVIYTPTGATSALRGYTLVEDGVADAVVGARAVELWDLKNIADIARSGRYGLDTGTVRYPPIPPYDGANYALIADVSLARAIKDDASWENAQFYGDPDKLFTGETGRIYGVRVIEENHLLDVLPNSAQGGQGIFIGDDPAIECVVTPEEVRIDIPRDFGRDLAMAWYYLGGFARIWDVATDGDNRIIRIDGAAS
jgi:N4-gp56 family major capsid protein